MAWIAVLYLLEGKCPLFDLVGCGAVSVCPADGDAPILAFPQLGEGAGQGGSIHYYFHSCQRKLHVR